MTSGHRHSQPGAGEGRNAGGQDERYLGASLALNPGGSRWSLS